jgi:hypothetical protein
VAGLLTANPKALLTVILLVSIPVLIGFFAGRRDLLLVRIAPSLPGQRDGAPTTAR